MINKNFFAFSILHLFCFFIFMSGAFAEDDIFARRGDGVVTDSQIDARIADIPENIRLSTIRDRKRLQDMINVMLLRMQLAEEARQAGFDEDPGIINRMKLAADLKLAEAWLVRYIDLQPDADYEALAYEFFLLNQDKYRTEETRDVAHILISTENRSEDEAEILANTILSELQQDPEKFDELVRTYSEDPSAGSNHGKFKKVKRGDMVKPFEDAAFAMNVGELSGLVKSEYGIHIIRLNEIYPAEARTFDDVKPGLVQAEKKKHRDRIRSQHLNELSSFDVEMTQEALESMVSRHFGSEAEFEPATEKKAE